MTRIMSMNLQYFAAADDGKTEKASSKKREDTRKKGQVAKSNDVVTAAMLILFFSLLKVLTGYYYTKLSIAMKFESIEFITCLSNSSREQLLYVLRDMILLVLLLSLPLWAGIFFIAFLANVVQVRFKIAKAALKPNFSKMNPLKGLKRMVSKDAIIEVLKSIVKGTILGLVIYQTILSKQQVFVLFYDFSIHQIIYHIGDTVCLVGTRVGGIFLLVGVVDYMYQRYKFEDSIKMSKQEVKEEFKQVEGDQMVKGKRRQKMRELSLNRMMKQVTHADVIITNPTHFAVAIAYQKGNYNAPVVVAKGVDHMARKIKEVAKEEQIQIVENRPLARALYYTTDLDQEIPPDLYIAVAEVLAFVYKLEKEEEY